MKKVLVFAMTIAMVFSLSVCAFTRQTETSDMIDDSVDRGGTITRIDIPNEDGTFTTLTGKEAQEWYDKAGEEGKQEAAEESSMQAINDEDEIETIGSFHYKYRYIESKRTKNVERKSLERTVTNKLRNQSSTKQSYTLSLSVSQSWSVSPSVTGNYKESIQSTLGSSWGKTYSKTESLTVDVKPHKTVWVTFIPIMDKSVGKTQKYYIPRGTTNKKPIIEKSYDVTTYNPKYLLSKIGPFKVKSVYGTYVWHEK